MKILLTTLEAALQLRNDTQDPCGTPMGPSPEVVACATLHSCPGRLLGARPTSLILCYKEDFIWTRLTVEAATLWAFSERCKDSVAGK